MIADLVEQLNRDELIGVVDARRVGIRTTGGRVIDASVRTSSSVRAVPGSSSVRIANAVRSFASPNWPATATMTLPFTSPPLGARMAVRTAASAVPIAVSVIGATDAHSGATAAGGTSRYPSVSMLKPDCLIALIC